MIAEMPEPLLSARFEEAMCYALSLHGSQLRKGTQIPYLSHLLAVSSLAMENGASEDEAIAALLHDAVEDHGSGAHDEIRQRFGDTVAAIVGGCTDSHETPRPPWRQRKERYLEHLRGATASMLLVTASDKVHNARCIVLDYRSHGASLWQRFKGGRDGVLWYYGELARVLGESLAPAPLVGELERTVAELRRLVAESEG